MTIKLRKPWKTKPKTVFRTNKNKIKKTIDKKFPIKLDSLDLIEAIYEEYPLVSKAEIAIVVLEILKAIRELTLLEDKTLNLGYNFNNIRFEVNQNRNSLHKHLFKYYFELPRPKKKEMEND